MCCEREKLCATQSRYYTSHGRFHESRIAAQLFLAITYELPQLTDTVTILHNNKMIDHNECVTLRND